MRATRRLCGVPSSARSSRSTLALVVSYTKVSQFSGLMASKICARTDADWLLPTSKRAQLLIPARAPLVACTSSAMVDDTAALTVLFLGPATSKFCECFQEETHRDREIQRESKAQERSDSTHSSDHPLRE